MSTPAPTDPTKVRLGASYWRLWTASVISNLGDGVAFLAYPWLASAVTRNAVLIALIAVAQRLPWLIFTLPAGVITDRVDRRKLIVAMDVARTLLTVAVAFVVLGEQSGLPSPGDVAGGADVATNATVYLVLLTAALAFGFAEVLRDNAAQTILPAIVEPDALEKANGNLWGAEFVANSFVGPPLGSLLLGFFFALPFFVDAGTFAVAAALIFFIAGDFTAKRTGGAVAPTKQIDWRGEIKEGFMWLWRHPVLRPLAIILGLLNGLGMALWSTFVLFAQENLDLETGLFTGVLGSAAESLGFQSPGAFVFAILTTGAALGGIAGSVLAPRVAKALGRGGSLYLTILASIVTAAVIGIATRWWVVFIMTAVAVATGTLWNVITVSLRQTIIPDDLLGRVNSVYRFFGWGMMPIGSLLGGVIVAALTPFVGRSQALRWPYFIVAAAYGLLFLYAFPRLTTEKLEAARAEGISQREEATADGDTAMFESGIDGVPPVGD